ncbi:hypothetical protein TNCV_4132091 [Trichonephila clavipes]|nr:hypothetical protein TNCV_4132091 [Trichonephila clavipes]
MLLPPQKKIAIKGRYGSSEASIAHCLDCEEQGKKRDFNVFEHFMVECPRSVGTSISKTAALMKCSRAVAINVCR